MEPEAEIIRAQLFTLRDEAYRTFHSALMPTVPPETVIGVRVPALRRLAKQLAGTAQAEVLFTGPAAWILRREQPPRVSDRTYPGLRQGAG